MTTLMRFSFILYIIFASSYDGALAHEFEEATHVISHSHVSSEESKGSIAEQELAKTRDLEHSSNSECPDSENGHTPHQCHMGHCGYLPQSISFSKERPEKGSFSSYIHIFKSRYLEGLFRPPRHS